MRIDNEPRVTPTWVRPLARQLIHPCEHGTYHVTCLGPEIAVLDCRGLRLRRLLVMPTWKRPCAISSPN